MQRKRILHAALPQHARDAERVEIRHNVIARLLSKSTSAAWPRSASVGPDQVLLRQLSLKSAHRKRLHSAHWALVQHHGFRRRTAQTIWRCIAYSRREYVRIGLSQSVPVHGRNLPVRP